MLWFSALSTLVFTGLLWRSYRQLQEKPEHARLASLCLAALIFGVLGTICFVAAALI